jgi:hypothetical protein
VMELGVRRYLWSAGGDGVLAGVLHPRHVAIGAVVAGDTDGALGSPFRGSSRFGGFVAWGDFKVAILGGAQSRVLLTRQLQIIPFVF